MADFEAKINWGTGFVLRDQESNYFIQQSDSMNEFERIIYNLQFRKDPYRLYIQYKDSHPVESIAGHCFRWECVSKTRKIANVKCLDCDSNEYFGEPRFDHITGAIFITDKYVVAYGDTWIDAVEISGEHVVCNVYVCNRFVSKFRIPAEVFDSLFGLKENFPKQYENVFGKADDAKPIQDETPQNKKIYEAYEISCLMDANRLCSDLLSSLIRLIGGTNSHYVSKDIYEKSQTARKAVEDLAIELGISIRNIEDGLQ